MRVAEFIGNDKAVKSLIEFLQTTEAGGRERVYTRSDEWECRVDRKEEEELTPSRPHSISEAGFRRTESVQKPEIIKDGQKERKCMISEPN